jgi:hypothetical protein
MSIRVLPRASDLRQATAGEAPPVGSRSSGSRRRIRDDARDGLAAAAMSLGGSVAVTFALALLLRWLG